MLVAHSRRLLRLNLLPRGSPSVPILQQTLRLLRCSLLPLLPFSPCLHAQTAPSPASAPITLTIHAGFPKAQSSPMLYGLMTEEINDSYDGGLYAELVHNRVVRPGWAGAEHWNLLQRGTAQATVTIDTTTGPSAAIPASLELKATSVPAGASAGVENDGYWGIPLRPQTDYAASFYAKAASDTSLTVELIDDASGKPVVAQAVPHIGSTWQLYHASLHTPAITPSSRYHIALSVHAPATVWLNLVSLFPPTYKARANGNRADLMEKLAAMHPAFLRFPGGNYLEGDHIADRYQWKQTIGPLVGRPTHPSPWQYRSSDGLGLLEFLEWCEDLHMQPLLAVYAGYSLQGEHVDAGPALAPYVQDALDEIEYVTGSPTSRWGAERAKDGHPAPFPLGYVEIGNEDEFDKSGSYNGRYAQFYNAIKRQYPQLQLIATTPVQGSTPDMIDDHFYRSAQEFYEDVHHYDATPRTGPKIFVGEWATREGAPTPNFGAALGDAAWMTGLERNSDVVLMASYAPLLTNVNPGGLQWNTDLIGYDAMESYGSPSYYAQVLFSGHRGDQILGSEFTGDPVRLFASVTRDRASGTLFLKLVNATTEARQLRVDVQGARVGAGRQFVLSAPSTEATNSITDPTRIVPVEHSVSAPVGGTLSLDLQPLSINVFELPEQH